MQHSHMHPHMYARANMITLYGIELFTDAHAWQRYFGAKRILHALANRAKAPSLGSLLITYMVNSGRIPIIGSANIKHIEENLNASKQELRSDVFDMLHSLRWLAQPCPQEGLRDVYGVLDLSPGVREELLRRYPGVCKHSHVNA